MDVTTNLIFLILLLLLSGFFSGSETALFALGKLQRRRLERSQERSSKDVLRLLSNPKRLLITILIGNMSVNTLSSATATALCLALFGDAGLGVAVPVMTVLLLIFGELTPKVFAVRNSELFSRRVSRPLLFFGKAMSFLVSLLEVLTDAIIEFLAPSRTKTEPSVTRDELAVLLQMGEEAGELRRREKELIDYIFDFQETIVREVMTPRVEILGLKRSWSPRKMKEVIKECRSARMPVYHKDLDDIDGILYTKDFLLSSSDRVEEFIHEVYFIPETKKVQNLLQDFRERALSIAIVLDEYGAVVGLVTLEDLLEEIFGEVYDEDEQSKEEIRKLEDGRFKFKGGTSTDDVAEVLGIEIIDEGEDEDYDTIAGFCLAKLGRIARKGDQFSVNGWRFKVSKTFKRRIVELEAISDELGPGGGGNT